MKKDKLNKLEITEYIVDISAVFEGEILNIADYLKNLVKTYPEYIKLWVAKENDCCECDEYHYSLMGTRLETDNEYEARIKRIKRAEISSKKSAITKRLKKEEAEKKQLKRLLEKYGKDKSI